MQRHQQLPALAWSAMYIKGIKRERAEVAVSDRNRALDLKKKYLKNENQQLQQQVHNWFFPNEFSAIHICLVFIFFTLFTAERVFALLCFRPGLRRLLRRDVLIPPRVLRECLKQESQFTAE